MQRFLFLIFVITCFISCNWNLDYCADLIPPNCWVEKSCQCGIDLLSDDRDGQSYTTVWIDEEGGNDFNKAGQCWMAENLNYSIEDSKEYQKYCYNDTTAMCKNYGGLYTWHSAMLGSIQEGARGGCPEGWKMPTELEYKKLYENIGLVDAGIKLATGCCNTTNSSGFTALFGGYRKGDGSYCNHVFDGGSIGARASFWTSTPNGNKVRVFLIYANDDLSLVTTTADSWATNFTSHSVRCICDM